jgi:hypothetical protein
VTGGAQVAGTPEIHCHASDPEGHLVWSREPQIGGRVGGVEHVAGATVDADYVLDGGSGSPLTRRNPLEEALVGVANGTARVVIHTIRDAVARFRILHLLGIQKHVPSMALDAILVGILARRPDRTLRTRWTLRTLRTIPTLRTSRPHGSVWSGGAFTAGCQWQQENDCGEENKFPHHLHLLGEGLNIHTDTPTPAFHIVAYPSINRDQNHVSIQKNLGTYYRATNLRSLTGFRQHHLPDRSGFSGARSGPKPILS